MDELEQLKERVKALEKIVFGFVAVASAHDQSLDKLRSHLLETRQAALHLERATFDAYNSLHEAQK